MSIKDEIERRMIGVRITDARPYLELWEYVNEKCLLKDYVENVLDNEIKDTTFNTECQIKGYKKIKEKLGFT